MFGLGKVEMKTSAASFWVHLCSGYLLDCAKQEFWKSGKKSEDENILDLKEVFGLREIDRNTIATSFVNHFESSLLDCTVELKGFK